MPITVGRMWTAARTSMIASQKSQLSATTAGVTGAPHSRRAGSRWRPGNSTGKRGRRPPSRPGPGCRRPAWPVRGPPRRCAIHPVRTDLELSLAAMAMPSDHPVLPAGYAGNGPPPGCRRGTCRRYPSPPSSSISGAVRTTCVVIATWAARCCRRMCGRLGPRGWRAQNRSGGVAPRGSAPASCRSRRAGPRPLAVPFVGLGSRSPRNSTPLTGGGR